MIELLAKPNVGNKDAPAACFKNFLRELAISIVGKGKIIISVRANLKILRLESIAFLLNLVIHGLVSTNSRLDTRNYGDYILMLISLTATKVYHTIIIHA